MLGKRVVVFPLVGGMVANCNFASYMGFTINTLYVHRKTNTGTFKRND